MQWSQTYYIFGTQDLIPQVTKYDNLTIKYCI